MRDIADMLHGTVREIYFKQVAALQSKPATCDVTLHDTVNIVQMLRTSIRSRRDVLCSCVNSRQDYTPSRGEQDR